jgi:hypothetical protein
MVIFLIAELSESLDYYPAVLDYCPSIKFDGCLTQSPLETIVAIVLTADV